MKDKVMGIIGHVSFGLKDGGWVMLYLDIMTSETGGSAHYLTVGETVKLVKEYGVSDINHLVGKPIWVTDAEIGGTVKIIGACKL